MLLVGQPQRLGSQSITHAELVGIESIQQWTDCTNQTCLLRF